jgi:hypothetical protein
MIHVPRIQRSKLETKKKEVGPSLLKVGITLFLGILTILFMYQLFQNPDRLVSWVKKDKIELVQFYKSNVTELRQFQTAVMTADLLGAIVLAQNETNPRLQSSRASLAPLSLADADNEPYYFEKAQDLCIENQHVKKIPRLYSLSPCWGRNLRSNTSVRRRIEITSAALTLLTKKILKSRSDTEAVVKLIAPSDLAIVVHLCGLKTTNKYIDSHFDRATLSGCRDGNFNQNYRKIKLYEAAFARAQSSRL